MINRRALFVAGVAFSALAVSARFGRSQTMSTTETIDYRKLSDMDWRQRLTADQYMILRHHGTERPGSSPLNKEKRKGTFTCAGCDLPLFSSDTKFECGTGWPSFYQPLANHVFDDGPKPTGLRYCMNGVALKFAPQPGSSS